MSSTDTRWEMEKRIRDLEDELDEVQSKVDDLNDELKEWEEGAVGLPGAIADQKHRLMLGLDADLTLADFLDRLETM